MSSMSQQHTCVDVSKDSFLAARRAWPGKGRDSQLPVPVRRVFDTWMAVSEDDRLAALEIAVREGFARRPGRDSSRTQCQDLTLSGSPLPVEHAGVRLLTAAQIVSMGDPTPSKRPAAFRNSSGRRGPRRLGGPRGSARHREVIGPIPNPAQCLYGWTRCSRTSPWRLSTRFGQRVYSTARGVSRARAQRT